MVINGPLNGYGRTVRVVVEPCCVCDDRLIDIASIPPVCSWCLESARQARGPWWVRILRWLVS
jgi:hypothetical protein